MIKVVQKMSILKSFIRKTNYDKMEKKRLKELARRVEYDDNYVKELYPKCFKDLTNNSDFLFESGWRDRYIFVRCKSCNQIVYT